ncbi:unnamed protein product [Pleuronectes platessa]|uniref:Uncharacterized protein n=1 Tax=Pleuronectes platessa TaxID=8262 RepID=A0A9N7U480_PLEPL|nr:unnamed protein product [Pleuronectes platessa]
MDWARWAQLAPPALTHLPLTWGFKPPLLVWREAANSLVVSGHAAVELSYQALEFGDVWMPGARRKAKRCLNTPTALQLPHVSAPSEGRHLSLAFLVPVVTAELVSPVRRSSGTREADEKTAAAVFDMKLRQYAMLETFERQIAVSDQHTPIHDSYSDVYTQSSDKSL